MPDSDPGPPPPPPPPDGSIVPSPAQPPKDTMVERGLFPGLFGDGDGEGGEPSEQSPKRRGKKVPRSEMGFLEHLEELRMTIVKSMSAIFIGMLIVGAFFKYIFEGLEYPLITAVGRDVAKQVLISPLDPFGIMTMTMSVSVYGGAILALPLVAYFIAQFIAPGLTLREKGMLRPALWSAVILFIIGVLGCFFIMLPAGLYFAYQWNLWLGFNPLWSASSYYSTVVWTTLATGLVFEFPLILVIMQVLGIIESDTLRRSRRYAVVIIAVIGALIAPSPDPGSMLAMMVPLLAMYEGAIIIGARLRKRRLAAQAQAARDAG